MQKKERQIENTKSLLSTLRAEAPLDQLLKRPEVGWTDLTERCPQLEEIPREVAEQVVNDVKYAGYIARQEIEINRQRRLAKKRIPDRIDYGAISQLRAEAREKLDRIRPLSLDQASRISGITPADVALLMTYLEGRLDPGH